LTINLGAPGPATSYTLTGPASGTVNSASTNFTITPVGGVYTGTISVALSGGGLSTTITKTFDESSAAQTFTITPTSVGSVTLTPTSSAQLGTDPSALTYTVNRRPAPPMYIAPINPPAQTSTIPSGQGGTGPTTGGNPYVITGSFTAPITSVQINGVTLPPSAWVQTATSITITMPAGAEGTVTIQIINGQSPLLPAISYTYKAPAPSTVTEPVVTVDKPLASTVKFKVFFGLGSKEITTAEKNKLKELATQIAGLGNKITIRVTGYAQPTPGSEKTDGALSKARASAVASYLRKAGVDTTVTYVGAGRAKTNNASSRYVEIVANNK
jgi:outer membrane protein OmpA-like peptidoglycan-associated protein